MDLYTKYKYQTKRSIGGAFIMGSYTQKDLIDEISQKTFPQRFKTTVYENRKACTQKERVGTPDAWRYPYVD